MTGGCVRKEKLMKRIKKYLALTGLVAGILLLMTFGLFASGEGENTAPAGDFSVTGDETHYHFDDEKNVLVIEGDVTLAMKDGVSTTSQSIIVSKDCTVTLNGINIEAAHGPAILIGSPNNVTLALANGSENYVKGAKGTNINATAGSFAGIEVEFEFEEGESPANKMASLTITGSTGKLTAEGEDNAAGIGGSNSAGGSKGRSLYGNITIEGGDITAIGHGGGAGIGSANNPNGGTSIGSYKTTGNNTWGTITVNGGKIKAVGSNSAGIGGGNHVDSGKIIINDGVIEATGGSGIGCGTGSSKNKTSGADKGPGYYYADIEINGGDITARAAGNDNWGGAGIGGGGYCDAIIKITGGTIHAYGGNCSDHNGLHHGGAGIGGGYESHADIEISGGDIYAETGAWSTAAAIGSGGSPNSNPDRGETGRSTNADTTCLTGTTIVISGGNIVANAVYSRGEEDGRPDDSSRGGAGIGGGVGADNVSVTITGGKILAKGAKSSEELKYGGAGIGGGLYASGLKDVGMTGNESAKYQVPTNVDIKITGGDVIAIGGWGASGIGSGALNVFANTIDIDFENASIQAYADGTKFAIDTRVLNEDGTTTSYTDGRTVTGNMLQGTFVHAYENAGMDQNPEGLKSIQVINDATGESKELKLMPDGYRSYATGVSEPGVYTVYTDEESIGKGEGRYFSKQSTDVFNKAEADQPGNIVQYTVENGKLSDNFYLFPVKTVVVEKVVNGPEEGTEGLNMTAYFALKIDNELVKPGDEDKYIQIDGRYFMKDGNGLWTESIDIKDGVPQSKAYFVNVDDLAYDVWEVDGKNSTNSPQDAVFGAYTLKSITTQHGGTIEATADGHTKGAFTVTKTDEGDKAKISVEVDFDKTEGLEWITVSLFADGKLLSEPSKSLSKTGDHTASWTVDKSKDGKEIVYAVADTSNNSVISQNQWSDEVTIINTYTTKKLPVDVTVKLTKELAAYYNAGKDARATAVFLITVTDKDGEKLAERYVSYVFKKTGEQTKTVTFKKLEGPTQLTIEEVYSSGYKGVIKGTSDTKAVYDLTDPDLDLDKPIELTFVNTPGKRKYTDGVINTYKNKKFDTSSDEEGE